MKRTLLAILALAFSTGLVMAQNPTPNASFENWEDITSGLNTYSEPVDWSSVNECTSILSIQPLTQSSVAHSGNSSANLTTVAGIGDIKYNGVLTTSTMNCDPFNPGITGGTNYDLRPDSIVGWFQYAPVDVDTAYVQVILFNQGDTVGYLKLKNHQTISEWTRFSGAIEYFNQLTPDVISVFFNSSWGNGNLGEGFGGSELLIDDVELIFNSTGIEEELAQGNWVVYPNPAVGEVNIRIPSGKEANIEILDVTGKRVKYVKVNEMESTIAVDQLVAGIYLYQITSLDKHVIKTGKLLINP